jgi:hypothetical protein
VKKQDLIAFLTGELDSELDRLVRRRRAVGRDHEPLHGRTV